MCGRHKPTDELLGPSSSLQERKERLELEEDEYRHKRRKKEEEEDRVRRVWLHFCVGCVSGMGRGRRRQLCSAVIYFRQAGDG